MSLRDHFAQEIGSLPNGVVIYVHHGLLQSGTILPHITLKPEDGPFIAENICHRCAVERGIGSFTFHLYGLYNPITKTWLAPCDEIQVSAAETKEFIFRIRYQPHESQFRQIAKKDKETFKYYFYQCRDDFVHNGLTDHLQHIEQRDILGKMILHTSFFGTTSIDLTYSL